MSKVDELWEKHSVNIGVPLITQKSFHEAIAEYGEHVKADAVKVCHAVEAAKWNMSLSGKPTTLKCAEAIKDMELK